MSRVGHARARRERLLVEKEWRRCSTDFVYWVENYVYIADKAGLSGDGSGRIRFELFDYQRRWAHSLLHEKFLVFTKARQIGATTISMAYCLWLLMYRRGGARILIISRDEDAAANNLQMLFDMYTFLPEWMKERGPRLTHKGATEKRWVHADGSLSAVASDPATDNVAAGFTPDVVVEDEADLYKNTGGFGAVQAVVQPALLAAAANPMYTSAVSIVISTVRNPKGKYAALVRAARAGKSRYKSLFEPWTSNRFMWNDKGEPDHDRYAAEREAARHEGREFEYVREYPASLEEAFQMSGHRYFTNIPDEADCPAAPLRGRLVQHLDPETGETSYRLDLDETGPLRVWEKPVAGREYVMSVDPSEGVGRDSTVATVECYDDDGLPVIAATWESNTISPTEYAPALADLGWWYNEALAAPETTGGHAALLLHVWDELGYTNLYYHQPKDQRRRRTATRPGFNTAGAGGVRDLILNAAREQLAQTLNIGPELRDELGVFVVDDKGRAAAEQGLHDDWVLSYAIATYVLVERVSAARVTTSEDETVDTGVRAGSIAHVFDQARAKERERQAQYAKNARRLERRWASQRRRAGR